MQLHVTICWVHPPNPLCKELPWGRGEGEQDFRLNEVSSSPAVPLGQQMLLEEQVVRQYSRQAFTGLWYWVTLGSNPGSAISCS